MGGSTAIFIEGIELNHREIHVREEIMAICLTCPIQHGGDRLHSVL